MEAIKLSFAEQQVIANSFSTAQKMRERLTGVTDQDVEKYVNYSLHLHHVMGGTDQENLLHREEDAPDLPSRLPPPPPPVRPDPRFH